MPNLSVQFGLCCFVAVVFATDVVSAGASSGETGTLSQPFAPQPLRLTLKGALAAALDNNPDVLLYKERIREAQGQVQTQLGAMLPNLSANVRQTRQTNFLGTIGISPVRTGPFSIFDARISATQNIFSLSLIQRWRAARSGIDVANLEAEVTKRDVMATVGLYVSVFNLFTSLLSLFGFASSDD